MQNADSVESSNCKSDGFNVERRRTCSVQPTKDAEEDSSIETLDNKWRNKWRNNVLLLAERLRIRNTIIRQFLAEFLGTFVMLVRKKVMLRI